MPDSPFLCLLAEYTSADEHTAHAQFAELVSHFHFKRAASIRARNAGNVPRAQLYENEAARLSRDIEENLAASERASDTELPPGDPASESAAFAQREHEVTEHSAD
jgi:hypothetical protein